MNEIVFLVNEPPEGGYAAEALGHAIYTTARHPRRIELDGARCSRLPL
jgi:hypothetical protein